MYEKKFLRDVALQNYSKYNIDVSDWIKRVNYSVVGKMFVINKRYPDDMIKTSTAIFGNWFQKGILETKMIVNRPQYLDSSENGILY